MADGFIVIRPFFIGEREIEYWWVTMKYDPMKPPLKSRWLALDESDRIAQVKKYHREKKVELPRFTLHATLHVIVENMLAEEIPDAVETMRRLQSEGLNRHQALHAVATAVMYYLHDKLNAPPSQEIASSEECLRYIREMTVEKWYESAESD